MRIGEWFDRIRGRSPRKQTSNDRKEVSIEVELLRAAAIYSVADKGLVPQGPEARLLVRQARISFPSGRRQLLCAFRVN